MLCCELSDSGLTAARAAFYVPQFKLLQNRVIVDLDSKANRVRAFTLNVQD